jgi:hypothetical protein
MLYNSKDGGTKMNNIERYVNDSVDYLAGEFNRPKLEVWNYIYDLVLYENMDEREAVRKTLVDYEKESGK